MAEWTFSDSNDAEQYQNLIKNNDVDGTYQFMLHQIEQKKRAQVQQSKLGYAQRAKRKVKNLIRPLYHKLKS